MRQRTAITLLAALTGLAFLTSAPAEARRHTAPQQPYTDTIMTNDGRYAQAVVEKVQVRGHKLRVGRQKVKVASLSPADGLQASPSAPGTIDAYRDRPADTAPAGSGLVTVQTAAGLSITCSPSFASEAAALIATAVAQGIRFSRITCYSRAASHVRGSNHGTGDAMDTHPSIPAHLVREAGLRSGCDFHDCMHVDNAKNVGGVAFWNRVKHIGGSVTASADRRHYHRHRRIREARR